ncbi:MAG: NERD domain-containing protein [Thiothrix sp.]|uniref:nuclease-related domain-containing protein n=1 Tax=Thiothrix sp. TaxID=1032 RepID=UPI00261393D7|nr:NERD domain-containing protein [Thiothrix sp.]MDD5392751.1 NERD domain-containing protein [Thiothrix sp.]
MQFDYTLIFIQLMKGFLLYLLPVYLLIAFFKSPRFIGGLGEWAVNLVTNLTLDKDEYHLIKNVTLPTKDGGTTQIDHVIVSRYGIFVVETKNMQGWIFGKEHDAEWTQKIYRHTTRFQNPLRQNYKHMKVLEECIGIDPACLHSVIIFAGDCTFKTPMPENVVYPSSYNSYLKSKRHAILSEQQVQEYIALINACRLTPSFATQRAHIRNIKQMQNSSQTKNHSSAPPCPKCGRAMVKLKTRHGPHAGQMFWGCPSFPDCRGFISIQEEFTTSD